jgi:hypothetical protein
VAAAEVLIAHQPEDQLMVQLEDLVAAAEFFLDLQLQSMVVLELQVKEIMEEPAYNMTVRVDIAQEAAVELELLA